MKAAKEGGDLTSASSFPAFWFYDGVIEVILNLLGTGGFVVGSLFWCYNMANLGCVVFAIACISCAFACTMAGVKVVSREDDYMCGYAFIQQAFGCVLFAIVSFTFMVPEYATISLIGFLTASLWFLGGTTLYHAITRTIFTRSPLFCCNQIIPCQLFNTLGSLAFVVGSVMLFYDWGQSAGAWLYEGGSIVFFLASVGDASAWMLAIRQKDRNRIAEKTRKSSMTAATTLDVVDKNGGYTL